jgi:hemerythrin superfamily protein
MGMYIPKTSYFATTRIEKLAKALISDCSEDRKRSLEAFAYFKRMVETDVSDDKSKTEMNKSLQLSQDANDKVVKVLDMMIKLKQSEIKATSQSDAKKEKDSFSFDSWDKKNG